MTEDEVAERLVQSVPSTRTWRGFTQVTLEWLYIAWMICAAQLPAGVWLLLGLLFVPLLFIRKFLLQSVLVDEVAYERTGLGASSVSRRSRITYFWHRNFCLHSLAFLSLLCADGVAATILLVIGAFADFRRERYIKNLLVRHVRDFRNLHSIAGLVVLTTLGISLAFFLPENSALLRPLQGLADLVNRAQPFVATYTKTMGDSAGDQAAMAYRITGAFLFVELVIFIIFFATSLSYALSLIGKFFLLWPWPSFTSFLVYQTMAILYVFSLGKPLLIPVFQLGGSSADALLHPQGFSFGEALSYEGSVIAICGLLWFYFAALAQLRVDSQ